ncbi:MAG: MBL fold metallo-hydrolase [Chthoniobacterales bacterium]|nr:MBL fold metallo-hydrolase [Chthoniobacterales bacterium]
MELVNLTRRTEIGANSYWLTLGGKHLILDAGMHPKREGLAATPNFSPVPEGRVDAIFITHAHQDHVGSLPVLTRREPQARVYMTEQTARIADVMLHNSVNVMTRQRQESGITEYPLFTHRGVEFCARAWHSRPVRKRFNLLGEPSTDDSEVTFEFFDAGHILGSVGILFRYRDHTVFYTGDVNFDSQTLMKGADFPREDVEVLIMETTRGDSPVPLGFSRADEEDRLARGIRRAFEDGGSVTIPVFALGKTQEVLAMLWKMRIRGLLAHVPIYIGGLSTKITEIYDALAASSIRHHPELQLLQEMAPYVLSGNEIHTAAPRKKCLFALSSGMMTEHTLSNIFCRKVLGDANQRLFFVGYSDPESPAGRIRSAPGNHPVALEEGATPIPLRCHIEEFQFSAHACRDSLKNYALHLEPDKVVLVHGDTPALNWFELELYKQLPKTEIIVPNPGQRIKLG